MDLKNSSFDVLAEVASREFERLESKATQSHPLLEKYLESRHVKRLICQAIISGRQTMSCRQSLNVLSLTESFSKRTFNECKNHYTYECMIIPGNCSDSFSSYGSEELALKKIKNHLMSHVKELRSIVNLQPSESLDVEQLRYMYECNEIYRKILESQRSINQPSEDPDVSSIAESLQSLLSDLPEGLLHSLKTWLNTRKYDPFCEHAYSLSACNSRSKVSRRRKRKVEGDVSDLKKSRYDVNVHSLPIPTISKVPKVVNSKPDVLADIQSTSTVSFSIEPQFVIKTPSFPYVHDPVSFDLAGIEEITADGISVDRIRPLRHSCRVHSDCSGDKKIEKRFLRSNKIPKNVNRSVLVCVENQEKFKSHTRRKSRRMNAGNDRGSNLENMQRIKEIALKAIEELNANSKKRVVGPLVCSVCKKKFSVRSSLISHLKSHAGIKEYICNICDFAFTRQNSLTYHIMVHENKTRFICAQCKKSFRHTNHYKFHLMTHKGPHTCPVCSLVFDKLSAYKNHLSSEHGKVLTQKGIKDRKVAK